MTVPSTVRPRPLNRVTAPRQVNGLRISRHDRTVWCGTSQSDQTPDNGTSRPPGPGSQTRQHRWRPRLWGLQDAVITSHMTPYIGKNENVTDRGSGGQSHGRRHYCSVTGRWSPSCLATFWLRAPSGNHYRDVAAAAMSCPSVGGHMTRGKVIGTPRLLNRVAAVLSVTI